MTPFIPGLQLSELFYQKAVQPILERDFPGLAHSAALIGAGSEVLGFDTEMSTDHGWGPRLLLFLRDDDSSAETIHETLRQKLPYHFYSYSTNFSAPDPADGGTQLLEEAASGPVNHRVEIHTLREFFLVYLNFDIQKDIHPADWLTFSEQKLRSITAGAVYHDEIGLEAVRQRFVYYPHAVWLYLLAAAWTRIGQEEHLMGRAGFVGDEIGSALIASRLVRDVMRLGFLMERQYAPYPKWFGTAFARLDCAPRLMPALREALTAPTWQAREQYLVSAYEALAEQHNNLNLTEMLPAQVSSFHNRPFRVIHAERFADALKMQIQDPEVKRIADKRLIGGIDLISDNTDLLAEPRWRLQLRGLYD
ncbi:MAG TPA: DUF4037 domain-containing protein [Aggregatilineaceae bacterium]|nr:DUF4037 domain-containing protein [Aggregatilineaceae bacterium]